MIHPVMRGGFLVSVALAGFSMFHVTSGWNHASTKFGGESPAYRMAQSAGPEAVLLDSAVPVDFLTSLRTSNPYRKLMVLGTNVGAKSTAATLEVSVEQARAALARDEVKYVVVSGAATSQQASLGAVVGANPQFKLLGTYPMGTSASTVSLYERIPGRIERYAPAQSVRLNADQTSATAGLVASNVVANAE